MSEDSGKTQRQGQSNPPTYSRVIKGGAWVFAARAAAQVLSLARLIILTWFLVPGDFGLMGIALATLALLETFTETGFMFALVHKPELDKADLDSAWSVSLVRGVFIFLIICLAAPLIARFFEHSSNPAQALAAAANHDLAVWVIRAFALTIVFRSITNIGIIFFRRKLQFNKLFIIDTTGLVVDVAVAIVIAVVYKSVWALVCGKLACESVRAVMSYAMHPYRPAFAIDRQRCDQLWKFGKWMFWSTVFFYFLSQGDSLVVGRVVGVAALGLYMMASRVAATPATEITNVITQVTFPAYSRMQDDKPRLRDAYIRVLKAISFLSFPLAGGLVVFAADFTRLFLKESWLPIVPIIQILAVNGLIMSIGSTTGSAFQAIGKPRIPAKIQLVKLIVLAVLIYPFTIWWGIAGTALAMLVATAALQPLVFGMFRRVIGCPISDILRVCRVPCVSTILMLSAVLAVRTFFCPEPSLYQFVFLVIIAGAVYAASVLLADILFGYGIRATARQLIGQLTGNGGGPSDPDPGTKGA
jgi:O-antigen/teichoic acid export membrane protein